MYIGSSRASWFFCWAISRSTSNISEATREKLYIDEVTMKFLASMRSETAKNCYIVNSTFSPTFLSFRWATFILSFERLPHGEVNRQIFRTKNHWYEYIREKREHFENVFPKRKLFTYRHTKSWVEMLSWAKQASMNDNLRVARVYVCSYFW